MAFVSALDGFDDLTAVLNAKLSEGTLSADELNSQLSSFRIKVSRLEEERGNFQQLNSTLTLQVTHLKQSMSGTSCRGLIEHYETNIRTSKGGAPPSTVNPVPFSTSLKHNPVNHKVVWKNQQTLSPDFQKATAPFVTPVKSVGVGDLMDGIFRFLSWHVHTVLERSPPIFISDLELSKFNGTSVVSDILGSLTDHCAMTKDILR